MWEDQTTQVYRLDDGTLVDWQRLSAALNSAIEGCLALGNVRVVSSTIAAIFGDSDVIHSASGFINRAYILDAWQRVVGGVASPTDCHELWSLFFRAFGKAQP